MWLKIFYKTQAAFWVCISSICKGMNKNIVKFFPFTDVDDSFQMIDMWMDTAITYEADEV